MEHDKSSPELISNLPTRRIRQDGWTVARQEAFLKALAACGCITDAARSVGMSRQSAHNLYRRSGAIAFRRAWDAAIDVAAPVLETSAWERAIKGVPRPIFYKGEQVGEYRHFDTRLAMFLLRYRRPHRYGAHLDRLPVFAPPAPLRYEEDGLDPDEGIGGLEFHLDDLVDEADFPGADSATALAIDGVNFVNFVGNDGERRNHHPDENQDP